MEQCHNCDGGVDQAIVAITSEFINSTGTSRTQFAHQVASQANKNQPEGAGDYYRLENRIKQQMSRVLNGTTPLSADMIVPIIAALPPSFADRATHSLFAPFGKMPCALPMSHLSEHAPEPVTACIQAIVSASSVVLATSEPAHDGKYDINDHPVRVVAMQNALIHLISAALREYHAMALATGLRSSYEQLHLQSPLFAGISSATTAQCTGQSWDTNSGYTNAQY